MELLRNMKVSTFQTPQMIIFGRGASKEIGTKAKELDTSKTAIITDKNIVNVGIADKLIQLLQTKGIEVSLFDEISGEPDVDMVENCVDAIKDKNPDLIVGLGGGSCMDAAKVVAILLKHAGTIPDYIGIDKVPAKGLHTILLPTTAGTGAEATPNAIITDKAVKSKEAIVSKYLLPDVAIVDPSFTDTLPPQVTAFTGVDAFIHALECYIGKKASPFTDIIALEAIRLIAHNLKRARDNGTDKEARDKLAFASLLGGIAITNSGTGGVHALAYSLGSVFSVPHGLANTIMLPWVSNFNIPASPSRFAHITEQMGKMTKDLSVEEAANEAVSAIKELVADMQIPTRLRDVGVKKKDILTLTESAAKVTRLLDNNPRELKVADIKAIYEDAF